MAVTTVQLEQAAAARAAYAMLQNGDEAAMRPGRGAMEDALCLVPRNGVLARAVTLMEDRRETMGQRCDALLDPGLAHAPVAGRDAVAMGTIVASYADTLDHINAVLDSMIKFLEAQVARLHSEQARDTAGFQHWAQHCRLKLDGTAQDVDTLDGEQLSGTVGMLLYKQAEGARHAAQLQVEISKLMACRAAQAQVMHAWMLALLTEQALLVIAR
jgi:hypothetical protein